MTGELTTTREGSVWRVCLNRPTHKNSLPAELCRELAFAVREGEANDKTGVTLLEASGAVFCAGVDTDAAGKEAETDLFALGETLTKPLIAAVQGPALGAGVALLAVAHVVVAAHGCTFGMNEIRTGRFPFAGCTALARAIGPRRAAELCLTGRLFTVPEALAWGLVHHSAPPFELEDRAMGIAEGVAASDRSAIAAGMRFIRGL